MDADVLFLGHYHNPANNSNKFWCVVEVNGKLYRAFGRVRAGQSCVVSPCEDRPKIRSEMAAECHKKLKKGYVWVTGAWREDTVRRY